MNFWIYSGSSINHTDGNHIVAFGPCFNKQVTTRGRLHRLYRVAHQIRQDLLYLFARLVTASGPRVRNAYILATD